MENHKSEEINELAKALVDFHKGLVQPKLNKEVMVSSQRGSYKFKYADLSTVIETTKDLLVKNGLAVSQFGDANNLVTLLTHTSGQWLMGELSIGQYPNMQALGSAITYLKRYSYCAILGIVADDDDDANTACGNDVKLTDNEALKAKVLGEVEKAQSRDELTKIWQSCTILHADAEVKAAVQKKGQLWKK
jgi:hypothetical protein